MDNRAKSNIMNLIKKQVRRKIAGNYRGWKKMTEEKKKRGTN